ncbi:MAG: hypothetical protein R6U96_00580 [Promethearchaeia archaeon]
MLYKAHLDISINEDLVSGLLTALNQFTIVELKQPIESIEMGGLRWVYLGPTENKLLFIAADTKDVDAKILKSRLEVIKQAFIDKYIENGAWKEEFDGNTERFKPFKDLIDEYYSQWLAADKVSTIAEFFDLLGIFQQILNLIQNILVKVDDPMVFHRLDTFFEHFSRRPVILENQELQKINFDKNSGFNIITINPNNCDMIVVEKQLVYLLRQTVNIIKYSLGHVDSLNYFLEENIFDYILNNIDLLSSLNLDKFLLRLFLTKSD